jgi:hypothetical protein
VTDEEITDVFIHFMTYQKFKWVERHGPIATVHWRYYGSDLYELLSAFHGFKLYFEEKRNLQYLSQIIGENVYNRSKRWITLAIYHRTFKRFIAQGLTTFRFWNKNDFRLLNQHFPNNATFKFFQYGAYEADDIKYAASYHHARHEHLNV